MTTASLPLSLPTNLPLLRARVSLRVLDETRLPAYKGALLRGGFGFAVQRAACLRACWGQVERCQAAALCPYRRIFETPRPPGVADLHDVQDVPRTFVIEPPLDGKTHYAAGDALEFGLVLIGRGIEDLPAFLYGFEQLGRMGLGKQHARARLERVEVLQPWQPVGVPIYFDERVQDTPALPLYDAATIAAQAVRLPATVRLDLRSPTRIKARGEFVQVLEPVALVQSLGWRVRALSLFHGIDSADYDYRALVAQAQASRVATAQVRWWDWERTSTRFATPRTMKLGGLVGSAVLADVSLAVRALLVLGTLTHVGKACVFGHGGYTLVAAPTT